MNRFLLKLPVILSIISVSAIGAENAENRSCNLQGREIALRISEEVSSALSARERNQVADIAEQVCLDYAGQSISNSISESTMSPESGELSLNEAVNESAETESEEGGLFSDVKIIDPEDRVRRPGLKRR